MTTTVEVISVGAAAVSAIGGALAAWAAHRSAVSAQEAQTAAFDAERRAGLRQIGQIASELLLEGRRVESRANETKLAYQTLFAFSGSTGGSRQKLYISQVDEKLKGAEKRIEYAKLFAPEPAKLKTIPLDEIDRVQTNVLATLTEVRALREDFEREYAGVEAQCNGTSLQGFRANDAQQGAPRDALALRARSARVSASVRGCGTPLCGMTRRSLAKNLMG